MSKSVLFSTIVLAFLLVVLGFKYFITSSLSPVPHQTTNGTVTRATSPTPKTMIQVTQNVASSGSAPQKTEQIVIEQGKTALDLLIKTHRVIMKGEGINAFITSIDGKIASDSKHEFWALYVNGKQAQVGAGSYYLKSKDTILWKIETY